MPEISIFFFRFDATEQWEGLSAIARFFQNFGNLIPWIVAALHS
ncbi:MAG TPA: hypothetical protein V6C91_19400 [Coleofasciculaceae cyanobacterium]